MTQDINTLERDIEESRARLDMTIDRLQDRLSVSGIVDDMLGTVRTNRYASVFDHTLAVIRRNPVPVMLVAAGVGWLIHRMSQDSRPRAVRPLPYGQARVPVASVDDSKVDPVQLYDPDAAVRSADPLVPEPLAPDPLAGRPSLNART
jgi:Protein of unknown function (DUF3618)